MAGYIYLDWNIIQLIKRMETEAHKDFARILNSLSKRFEVPYSDAHLEDLAAGYSEETKKYTDEDLTFLSDLSKSKALALKTESATESVVTVHHNCRSLFEKILSSKEKAEDPPIIISFGPKYRIEMSGLAQDNIFRAALKESNGVFDATVFNKVMQDIWEMGDDPEFYKKFRAQVGKTTRHLEGVNCNLAIMPLLRFLCLDDEDELQNAFIDALSSFIALNGDDIKQLKIGEKIERAYGLLDFHPKFSEKIKKNKNGPSNIRLDCKHFCWAAHGAFYISEDASALKKAKFIAKTLGLKVHILNMSDFVARFS